MKEAAKKFVFPFNEEKPVLLVEQLELLGHQLSFEYFPICFGYVFFE